jgi:hypothetical protein|tara:strand:+ start:417 stop:632 length:216 start_codon:yes stop_codon:yes gene_type:complete
MTLKEYIANLKLFAETNPETLELEVITSKDDEGNGFNPVYYSPSKGEFKDRDFVPSGDLDDDERVNAVCVN